MSIFEIWKIGFGVALGLFSIYVVLDKGTYPFRQTMAMMIAFVGMSAIWFITGPAVFGLAIIKFFRRRAVA